MALFVIAFSLQSQYQTQGYNYETLCEDHFSTLPDWATVITQSADLIEVEINDEHPNFQSLLEELETEIEPGTFGVKAEDLCSRLGIEMSNPHLHHLVEQAHTLICLIATHPNSKQLLDNGYSPDLNIADAQTALIYLQWELERNQQFSV
ncbi:hypothetical protein LC653_39900 [Nostoc sp. CHAB 5784]|uniref:hypothetical protein n=1 Tax=Nostoc mirabile TaxID=2907820 RepID=UPI001E620746|nr:hypothetical protein [Nostoc mirabile]MCC5669810.1 hypothetical protein [Nostoc mirabile CHAB5784]